MSIGKSSAEMDARDTELNLQDVLTRFHPSLSGAELEAATTNLLRYFEIVLAIGEEEYVKGCSFDTSHAYSYDERKVER